MYRYNITKCPHTVLTLLLTCTDRQGEHCHHDKLGAGDLAAQGAAVPRDRGGPRRRRRSRPAASRHAPAHAPRAGRPPRPHGGHRDAGLRRGRPEEPRLGRGGKRHVRARAGLAFRRREPERARSHRPQREPPAEESRRRGIGRPRSGAGGAVAAAGPGAPPRLSAPGRGARAPRGRSGVDPAVRPGGDGRAGPRLEREPARDDGGLRRAPQPRRPRPHRSAHVSGHEKPGPWRGSTAC